MAETAQEPEINDEDLVARTQNGDPRAFDDLVRKYSSRLYGLVYNMTSNHEDTNDLLQDIFAKAYRSIKGSQVPEVQAEVSALLGLQLGEAA